MRARLLCIGLLGVGALLLNETAALAKEAASTLQISITKLVLPYLDNEIVGGMTVGVIQGEDAQVFGFGQLSKTDNRTADGETIYEIGSMSKVFTGLLLADAVVQGRVKLNQPAGELLPKSVKMPSFGDQPITLQHLSTHVLAFLNCPTMWY